MSPCASTTTTTARSSGRPSARAPPRLYRWCSTLVAQLAVWLAFDGHCRDCVCSCRVEFCRSPLSDRPRGAAAAAGAAGHTDRGGRGRQDPAGTAGSRLGARGLPGRRVAGRAGRTHRGHAAAGPTLADVLGIQNRLAVPVMDTLTDHLADKQLLLVLDNCEHLLDVCAVLASQLLAAAARVRILATTGKPCARPGSTCWRCGGHCRCQIQNSQ